MSASIDVSDVVSTVRRHARRAPNSIAVRAGERTIDYRELSARVNRVANGILGDLEAGQNMAVLAPNCLEYPELVLGIGAAGRAATLINARWPADEIGQICAELDVGAVFAHVDLRETADAAGLTGALPVKLIGGDEYEHWLANASAHPPAIDIAPDSPFLVPFTGGTTGRAKGVLLSHRSRAALYTAMRHALPCYSPADRNLTIAPMYHGAGFNFGLATLYWGGSVTMMTRNDPEELLHRIASESITNASVVPTHLVGLLDLGIARLHSERTASLRALISNGAPLSQERKAELVAALGPSVLYDAYGSTEAGVISVLPPGEQLRRAGSVGRLFASTQARIVGDSDGLPVRRGEVGEVFTRSPFVFSGYWGRTPHPPDDWFSAGDIGFQDEDGYLYLVARKDEKIITGGLNVFPREVESAIVSHPAVNEVVVFGAPDDYWGEAITAVVELGAGVSCTEPELTEHAARTLARYKLPKHIYLVDRLPRTGVGKVERQKVRDAFLPSNRRRS